MQMNNVIQADDEQTENTYVVYICLDSVFLSVPLKNLTLCIQFLLATHNSWLVGGIIPLRKHRELPDVKVYYAWA